jgi:hypothetical protein
MSARRDSPAGYTPRDPLPARAAEPTDTALLRQHVVAALRVMLDQVQQCAIDATRAENGVSVILERGGDGGQLRQTTSALVGRECSEHCGDIALGCGLGDAHPR